MTNVTIMDVFGDVMEIKNVVEVDLENQWIRTEDGFVEDIEGCTVFINDNDDGSWK